MMQLSLFDMPTSEYELVSSQDLKSAWDWLLSQIRERPALKGKICLFDNKCWDDVNELDLTSSKLAILYISSQLGDHKEIISMIHGATAPSVIWAAGPLDKDVKAVVTSQARFRNHLSEHLAFWVRLAVEVNNRKLLGDLNTSKVFSYSKPNMQPEDKGADGLYIELSPKQRIEIQSVKNSLKNPQPLISSVNFRKKGVATPKKLLDDFWHLRYRNDGLARLSEQLDHLTIPLNLDLEQKMRFGLIANGSYNAVVVTDAQYANEVLFNGYQFVTDDISQRIATYIGSNDWKNLAEHTFGRVQTILKRYGLTT